MRAAGRTTRRDLFRRGAVLAALGVVRCLPVPLAAYSQVLGAAGSLEPLEPLGAWTVASAPVAGVAAALAADLAADAEDDGELVGIFE